MSEWSMSITDGGGIRIEIEVDDGSRRAVEMNPQDDGTLEVASEAADGTVSRGKMDPSGNGNQSLGI
jgi:hypothetical protein